MIISEFHKRLSERIKEMGINVDTVAEKTGINRATIYRYLNGDTSRIDMNIITKLADFLNVSPIWLCGWSEVKYNANEKKQKRLIPLLGHVHAGLPVYAEEHIEEYISCEDEEVDYALTVEGDSMIRGQDL